MSTPKPNRKAEAPSSRGRGRPVGDREAKRTELLDAALAVIAEEGIAAASLRRVAERAGCSTGAVTYYFANREEMMAAVIESQFDVFVDTVSCVLTALGLYLSFTGDAKDWFDA